MIFLFNLFSKPRQTVLDKNYSDFISELQNDKVREVETHGRNISWINVEGKTYKTYAPEDPDMIKILREKKVVILVDMVLRYERRKIVL